MLGFITLSWIFCFCVAVHNLEEAIWLPAWSQTAAKWHGPIGPTAFRFAVVVLTLFAFLSAALATIQGRGSFGAYLISGYALAMLLNVLFPHLLATLALGRYMPGTATAVLLNAPITIALLYRGMTEGYIASANLMLCGPLVVIGIVISIPILFFMGRLWDAAPRR